ncbi:hypothetical protein MASR2M66_02890 [Chloroflexota bacterium]
MFQSIQVDEIFDLNTDQDHPAYWLAQLRKADWRELLNFVDLRLAKSVKKQMLAEAALVRFDFEVCESRAQVWKIWQAEECRRLVIQFRHSETDWTRGTPEFVHLDKGEPLGFVNIAARLICKVK